MSTEWWCVLVCLLVAAGTLGMVAAFHVGREIGREDARRDAARRRRPLSVGPQRRVVLPVRDSR